VVIKLDFDRLSEITKRVNGWGWGGGGGRGCTLDSFCVNHL